MVDDFGRSTEPDLINAIVVSGKTGWTLKVYWRQAFETSFDLKLIEKEPLEVATRERFFEPSENNLRRAIHKSSTGI